MGSDAFPERLLSEFGGVTSRNPQFFCSVQGICFIRTSRPENAIIYNSNEDFQVGQAKVSVLPAPMTPQRVSLKSGPTQATSL